LSSSDQTQKGYLAAEITREVVKLLREYTGRGPTKAHTLISESLVSVVLQDTLTMGERSLVRDGEGKLVLETRRAFQQTMSAQMIAAVERHTGRRVEAFLSANHLDPDVALESFMLAPPEENANESPEPRPTA